MDGKAGAIPELGAGGAREDGLNLYSLVSYLVMEGLSEVDHVGLGAAVGPVEELRRECNDGSDVDDETLGALEEARKDGSSKTRKSGHVELNHILELFNFGIDKLGGRTEARVVDESGDSIVRAETLARRSA